MGLIRDRYGVRVAVAALAALVVANLGTTCAEFAGVAASLGLLGVPSWISVPVAAVAVSALVLRGSFHRVERVLLALSTVFVAYILSGILAGPGLVGGRARPGRAVDPARPRSDADGDRVPGHDARAVGIGLHPVIRSRQAPGAEGPGLRTHRCDHRRGDDRRDRLLRRRRLRGHAARERTIDRGRRRRGGRPVAAGGRPGVAALRRRAARRLAAGCLDPAAVHGVLGLARRWATSPPSTIPSPMRRCSTARTAWWSLSPRRSSWCPVRRWSTSCSSARR